MNDHENSHNKCQLVIRDDHSYQSATTSEGETLLQLPQRVLPKPSVKSDATIKNYTLLETIGKGYCSK
jgi:hypothetical protein